MPVGGNWVVRVGSSKDSISSKEIDLRVQTPGGDVGDLADAPEWRLVHQGLEDQRVLVRLFLADGRRSHGEGFAARIAAIALGNGFGGAVGAVAG